MKRKSSYEDLQGHIRSLKTPGIEVWKNQYADKTCVIVIDIPEFTCICPKTGLPDFATIQIEYIPGHLCVELKSLKEYMTFYRNVGIFHEHFAHKLMEDFVNACRPRRARITTKFNPRGGIATTVERTYDARRSR